MWPATPTSQPKFTESTRRETELHQRDLPPVHRGYRDEEGRYRVVECSDAVRPVVLGVLRPFALWLFSP